MSSLEMNKIAAAILTAGVIAGTTGLLAQLIYRPAHHEGENIYLFGEVGQSGEAQEASAQEASLEEIGPLLAAADPAAGEKQAKKCTSCHTFEQGGADKIGPNLWNIIDQPIGGGGFAYSEALAGKSSEVWTYENLNGFLANPKGWAPGTKMGFAGIKKVGQRADLIAYMRGLSDNPAPLP
ncbi:MAG: cytochrome c family protein [Pseudomonadota bacterium]